MTHLLIWGTTHDLVADALPQADQVSSLAALREAVGRRGSALVLADPAHIEPEKELVAAWLRDGGSSQAVIMAVAGAGETDEVLRRLPFVDDVLMRPVSASRLRLKLERAVEIVHSRRVVKQLELALSRKGEELRELNRIGIALSAERDIDALLELILGKMREITCADAGSLYLVERTEDGEGGDRLRFKLTQNDSFSVPFEEFSMPLDHSSIAGHVALSGEPVNVADAYQLPPGSPFQISRAFDRTSGYRTKSMLVVPMRDHHDAVIGVVQLINKKRERSALLQPVSLVEEEVVSFASLDEDLAGSLASQAAVALENARLIEDIRQLFESFVRASVTAIEQRDPTTSGHSERVATLTVALAERVDGLSSGPYAEARFTREELRELRYAALLHDFGKVGVREKVLIKGKKLYFGQMKAVRQRFAYIGKSLEAEHLGRRLELLAAGTPNPMALAVLDEEYAARRAELARLLDAVVRANEPSVLEEESARLLLAMPSRSFVDWDGESQPYLTASELAALSIRKGSLSEEERREIESHVTHTYEFLKQIPWTSEFRRVPEIAWAHHEKLDGTGYPRQLTGAAIPLQSRMMTVADIYDALVAWDRPYKRAVSVERALSIIGEEVSTGRVDPDLFEIFVSARIFERTLRK
jgi:HD-GYP domain-containing protein (c-di-GMP phosphodiesterase class II)